MDAAVADLHLMSLTEIVSNPAIAFGRIFIMDMLDHTGDLKICDFTSAFPAGCPVIVGCTRYMNKSTQSFYGISRFGVGKFNGFV